MTPSGTESSSKEGSQVREDEESSVTPSSFFTSDAFTHKWGVEGMDAIFLEGMHPKDLGKLTHSIYKEPQVIDNGLSCVPKLKDTMT